MAYKIASNRPMTDYEQRMAEYIEREALMVEHEQYITEHPEIKLWTWSARLILNAPAADVQPVVHGHMSIYSTYIECSECGERFTLIPFPCNFCPNCGARMDEVIDDG